MVIYSSRLKCLTVAVLLLFPMTIILSPVVLILSGLIHLPRAIELLYFVGSVTALPFIFPFWAFCLYRAFVLCPAVSLSFEGIHETSWVLSPGLIRWTEISSISTVRYGLKRWLLIITHDPQPVWERMPIIKRLGSKFQSVFVVSPFMMPEHLIEGSLDDLVDKIQNYYEINIRTISNNSL
jgi:hypothetical protein